MLIGHADLSAPWLRLIELAARCCLWHGVQWFMHIGMDRAGMIALSLTQSNGCRQRQAVVTCIMQHCQSVWATVRVVQLQQQHRAQRSLNRSLRS